MVEALPVHGWLTDVWYTVVIIVCIPLGRKRNLHRRATKKCTRQGIDDQKMCNLSLYNTNSIMTVIKSP